MFQNQIQNYPLWGNDGGPYPMAEDGFNQPPANRTYRDGRDGEFRQRKLGRAGGPNARNEYLNFYSCGNEWTDSPVVPCSVLADPNELNFISKLDEDCLIILFHLFPIQQQILFRQVCKFWNDVIMRIFERKKSIKLFGSMEDVHYYCLELPRYNLHRSEDFILYKSGLRGDDLVCQHGAALYALPDLFPNLLQLTICSNSTFWQLDFHRVLPNMRLLESLTMFGVFYNRHLPQGFWTAVNRVRTLKKLHLLDMVLCVLPIDLSVLGRLEQFTLIDYQFYTGSFIQELGRNLKVLRLVAVQIDTEQLRHCLKANPYMARNLSHLIIGYIYNYTNEPVDYRRLFSIICESFVNLESIDILVYRNIRFYDLFSQLSQLTKLTELSINMGYGDEDNYLELASHTPPLHSVKRLLVKDYVFWDLENFLKFFPHIFPQIEFLEFYSHKENFLHQLEAEDLPSYFPLLKKFKPQFKEIHDKKSQQAYLNYSYAGRHQIKFCNYMIEAFPEINFPEDDHDEMFDFLYVEGGGDDQEMFDAVLNY